MTIAEASIKGMDAAVKLSGMILQRLVELIIYRLSNVHDLARLLSATEKFLERLWRVFAPLVLFALGEPIAKCSRH